MLVMIPNGNVCRWSSLALAVLLFMIPQSGHAAFNPNFIISDRDFTNVYGMVGDAIQRFLNEQTGVLNTLIVEDVDGATKSAAEIVKRVSNQFLINPQAILVMLQKEQSLVTDPSPSQNQLDWATGYGVCDGCSTGDGAIARFRGFAKQVDSMAQQFRLGYLADLERTGKTQTGIGPGKTVLIDAISVTPENQATSALYTYTPHLEGNQNFWRIWNEWFLREPLPSGTIVKDATDSTLWLIARGQRRFIPSDAVLTSYFSSVPVVLMESSALLSYPEGTPLAFPNYSLVHVESGDVYLIVDQEIRRFQSLDDLPRFGYAPDEVMDGTLEALKEYRVGKTITYQSVSPQGFIGEEPTTGERFYIEEHTRHAILSDALLRARFPGWRVRPVTQDELSALVEGDPVRFQDGTLVKVSTSPTVYMISDSTRRPIIDERTFLGLGFTWDAIMETSPSSIELHPPGDLITY